MTDSDTLSQHQSQLVEMLLRPPILEMIRSFLSLPDFLALFQVCKRLYTSKNHVLRFICGINAALKSFVADVTMFRSQLGHYNAVISGPFALNFFQLSSNKVSKLDIFVKEGADADQFRDYLQRTGEYKNDSEVDMIPRRRVYRRLSQPNIQIHVTQTTGLPIETILTSSSTTAIVNVITWNKAYCIFPHQTLIKHEFYPLRPLDDDFGSELGEISLHGWTNRDIIWPDHVREKSHSFIPVRRVADSSSLVIALDTNSVIPQAVPDYVIEFSQFEISGDGLQFNTGITGFRQNQGLGQFGQDDLWQGFSQNTAPRWSFLRTKAKEFSSPALCHCYIITSSEWRDFVSQRVQRWAWLEVDLTDSEGISSVSDQIREDHGNPTVLINNSGFAELTSILDSPESCLRKLFDVNLLAPYLPTKQFLPSMIERDHGHIVNIASQASFATQATNVANGSTKVGLLAFHEGLGQELRYIYKAPRVRTSVVRPSWIRTAMTAELVAKGKLKDTVTPPEVVAGRIFNQVISGFGAQIIVPSNLWWTSLIRGLPGWLQESLRNQVTLVLINDMGSGPK
ncbi:short-chain dehydrogenase reductase [Fusarium agapanthi]|uniref:Short-chain dehydrogenase reductase n=1 Tax=Fusarium agapanthi TaxID=1803897 RepID=A0A9P5E2X7_9HYPO|nr:short-chain dehydrogenase reductase [Fusarium agapanthi]